MAGRTALSKSKGFRIARTLFAVAVAVILAAVGGALLSTNLEHTAEEQGWNRWLSNVIHWVANVGWLQIVVGNCSGASCRWFLRFCLDNPTVE